MKRILAACLAFLFSISCYLSPECRVVEIAVPSPSGSGTAVVYNNGSCGGGLGSPATFVEISLGSGEGGEVFRVWGHPLITPVWQDDRNVTLNYVISDEDSELIQRQVWGVGGVRLHYRRSIDPKLDRGYPPRPR